MNSGLFKIDWKDLVNGLITVVIGAIATQLLQLFAPAVDGQMPHVPTLVELKASVWMGVSAGAIYLLKRFVSNNSGDVLKK